MKYAKTVQKTVALKVMRYFMLMFFMLIAVATSRTSTKKEISMESIVLGPGSSLPNITKTLFLPRS